MTTSAPLRELEASKTTLTGEKQGTEEVDGAFSSLL